MNKLIFNYRLIAPCGMNCGICRAHLRENNPCHGCNDIGQNQPKTREHCRLRLCEERKGKFCYGCAEFPCKRLRQLDHRYQTRYGISEIENLVYIRNNGIKRFIEGEYKRCVFDEGILCVHDKKYYK
jgi:hypothetical protein